ncbi:MAG TPA: hypothetical protein VKR43_17585 [Bryobacteraceae bacterium]|jgi:hypothetical protein|nr:hypothetical protein [Bryobacteraceae bacterium]
MSTAISDELGLADADACWAEWNRCLRWERHHQNEHDEWLRENPSGNARILAIVGYWRERRIELEARLKQLSERSRSAAAVY